MGQSTGGGKGGSGQQQQGPFNFGPSAFDLQAIMNALGTSETAMTNRYKQLGLGGSTMLQQDLGNAPSLTGGLPKEALAMVGQMQTQDVGNAAFNPALQSATSTPQTGMQNLTSLTSLANTLGGNAGLQSVTGGATT